MAKSYNVNTVNKFENYIKYFAVENALENEEHYAAKLCITAEAVNGAGVKVNYEGEDQVIYLGTPKSVPWTPQEVYTYLNGFCPALAAKMKSVYEELIDVDPSQ